MATLGALSIVRPYALGPAANPAHTQYLLRPEWYYRPMFQELKYFPCAFEIVGILVIPGIVIALLVAVPFIDRSVERRPWKRPIAMGVYAAILLAVLALGIISFWQDSHNPAIAKQLQNQRQETQHNMAAPFRPYSIGRIQPFATATSPNPLIQKGQTVFTGQGCNSCHGEGGVGTSIASSLVS